MLRKTLKKLLALLLSILMVISAFPMTALATGDGGSMEPAATDPNFDASDPVTGLPNLYVDFLGDNIGYNDTNTTDRGKLLPPTPVNWSIQDGQGNWNRYVPDHVGPANARTIFWIGVGVDRMQVLDLFRENNDGVYSLELGFYYNDFYVEPYVAPGSDYQATIQAANVNNGSYPNQWASQYSVITALTGLEPQTDWVTQENLERNLTHTAPSPELVNPDMDEIMGLDPEAAEKYPNDDWKMTYIALERTDMTTGVNRFQGAYDPDFQFNPEGEETTEVQYFLMIPFVLKNHDSGERLCLRLARNAHLFTLGAGGGVTGADEYAAWERVTTRNPDHNIKLMTNFTGDLNIFTGDKELENDLDAELRVEAAGQMGNTADLHIDNDPSPNPVHATVTGQTISGLYGGTGMAVDVTCTSDSTVTVKVYRAGTEPDPDGTSSVTPEEVPVIIERDQERYTFVMPEYDVVVVVTFTLRDDVTDFSLYLEEDRTAEDPGTVGNKTTIAVTAPDPGQIDSYTVDEHGDPVTSIKATIETPVTITVETHADYDAVVRITTANHQPYTGYTVLSPAGAPVVDGAVTLESGGKLEIPAMPRTDLVVHVTYVRAKEYTAYLEVWHSAGSDPVATNVAQLSYPWYPPDNQAQPRYSGVVYHDYDDTAAPVTDDHSAVEAGTTRVLAPVDRSEARISGSLGGDQVPAMAWQDLMALAYQASAAGDFTDKLLPRDLRDSGNHLYRDLSQGEYTDRTVGEVYDALAALSAAVKGDPALTADYVKSVGTGAAAVTYLDLTREQVQLYLMDYRAYQADLAAAADPSTVTPPPLRTAADAATDYAALTWTPSPVPTAQEPDHVTTRTGRSVALTLEADSAYTVDRIQVLRRDNGTVTTLAVAQDPDYQNVYHFTMPTYDCTVRVYYKLRSLQALRLVIQGDNGLAANNAVATAYTADSPNHTPAVVTLTKGDGGPKQVFGGSTVSVLVRKDSEHMVSAVVAFHGTTSGAVTTTPVDTTDLADGTVFTFVMPEDPTTITITYTETPKKQSNAYIHTDHVTTDTSRKNVAYWDGTSPRAMIRYNVSEGTHMITDIEVDEGYYVYSAWATTANGAVDFSLSGNGYNNGAGGMVTLETTMPAEDLHVYVVYAKGPPDEEPHYALRLQVRDPENETSPYAGNGARLRVDSTSDADYCPMVTAHGAVTSYQTYVNSGQQVTVEVKPDRDYYVSAIAVTPGSAGVNVEWTDETHFTFTTPGAPTTVTVTFSKTDPQRPELGTYFLNIDRTETSDSTPPASTPADSPNNNHVTFVDSQTIQNILQSGVTGETRYPVPMPLPQRLPTQGTIGVAKAGELVTLEIRVAPGWHVHALTITSAQGNSSYTVTNGNNNSGTAPKLATATFRMPSAETSVVVHFHEGEDDADTAQRLGLRITDADNTDTNAPADNWAQLTVAGKPSATVGPMGKARGGPLANRTYDAVLGDLVTIEFHPAAGYSLDYIRMGPAGTTIVPVFLSDSEAQFTMPSGDAEVEVCFKKGAATRYTADLILRAPSARNPATGQPYTVAQAGSGTFTTGTAGVLGVNHVYSAAVTPGTALGFSAKANDGFYIKRVTITPATTQASATLTGSFGVQDGVFRMPAAHVYVNVWFEAGWPDEATFDLTVRVTDPGYRADGSANNSARVNTVAGTPVTDVTPVYGGQSHTWRDAARDQDEVFVSIDTQRGTVSSITVTGRSGRAVDWVYAPGGIRFLMPAEGATVHVSYQKDPKNPPHDHRLWLYVTDYTSGKNNTVLVEGNDLVNGKTIQLIRDGDHDDKVSAGTQFKITATPDTDVWVDTSYAHYEGGGAILTNALYDDGTFAMPDHNACVHVIFRDKNDRDHDDEPRGILQISGPNGSGRAEMTAAVEGETPARTTGAVINQTGGPHSGSLTAPINTEMKVDITVNPGYYVQSLRVVERTTGNRVDYRWSDDGSGIEFTMPARGVLVQVNLDQPPDHNDPDRKYRLTLYVTDYTTGKTNTVSVADIGGALGIDLTHNNDSAAEVPAGTQFKITTTPDTDVWVATSYAHYEGGGAMLTNALYDDGTFTMPAHNACAHVVFRTRTDQDHDDQPKGILQISGPHGSGYAEMTAAVVGETTARTTGVVYNRNGGPHSGSLTAPAGTDMRVEIQVNPGYHIQSLRVVERTTGNPVSYQQSEDGTTLELTMPARGVLVQVELAGQVTPPENTYRVQLVVNDSANTSTDPTMRNTAGLALTGAAALPGSTVLSGLSGGEQIFLGLDVKPGYRIQYVTVVSQNHGIRPALPLGDQASQTTSFTMPYADIVVYVRFTTDGLRRYNAVLDVVGTDAITTGNAANIHSPVTGLRGPIVSRDRTVSVQAAPNTEWITVKYGNHPDLVAAGLGIASGCNVKGVTVNAGSRYVPVTQVDEWTITFPMPAADVRVVVEYKNEPDPEKYPVVLHLIDETGKELPANTAWAQLLWRGVSGDPDSFIQDDTDQLTLPADRDPNEDTMYVPAGKVVDLECFANTGYYIRGAYVLYRAHGQMIKCNLPAPNAPQVGFTGEYSAAAGATDPTHKNANFTVHQGTNDVYVYVTDKAPTETRYSAVLMLTGPAGDTVSDAVISGGGEASVVKTNGPHGYITVDENDLVTVTVSPAPGYEIDFILVTPLGIQLTDYTRTPDGCTFKMPAENVAIHVALKAGAAARYHATLHVMEVDDAAGNRGRISYTDSAGTLIYTETDWGQIEVPEGQTVDISSWISPSDTLLSAFVMREGVMVPVTADLEGSTDQNPLDNTVVDAETAFTMPGADVDVFLVYTAHPPAPGWQTAVLVVTDEKDTLRNSGLNNAFFSSTTASNPISEQEVKSYGLYDPTNQQAFFFTYVYPGDGITIKVGEPAKDYVFDAPATLTASTVTGLTLMEASTNPYTYIYTAPASNTAVNVHFKGQTTNRTYDLTVRIVDDDNPGDGTMTNEVTVEPRGMTPLTLRSTTSAGAVHFIEDVTEGERVSAVVTPDIPDGLTAQDFLAVATLSYGTTTRQVALTPGAGGTYTGSFEMPGADATFTVRFYRAWRGSLALVDSTGLILAQADRPTLTESAFGEEINVSSAAPNAQFSGPLPNGTRLTAAVPDGARAKAKLTGVLVTTRWGTSLLAPAADGTYPHVISRSDAKVTVVMDGLDSSALLATVSLVNAPDNGAGAAIRNDTNPTAAGGDIWTKAVAGDGLTVHVDVPAGYKAVVTNSQNGDRAELTASGDQTFTMPGINLHITVRYVRTDLTAILVIQDTWGGSSAGMTDGATTITVGNGAANRAEIAPVAAGTAMTVTTTPASDSEVSAVILRQEDGTSRYLDLDVTPTFVMPEGQDVVVTVIMTRKNIDRKQYVVNLTTAGRNDVPGNEAVSVADQTNRGLPKGNPPFWAVGLRGDQMLATYTVASGYVAVVTARAADGTALPVLQQDLDNRGTAAITMPDQNATITVTYYGEDERPEPEQHHLTLSLVGHDQRPDNQAHLYLGNGPDGTFLGTANASGSGSDSKYSVPNIGTAALGDALYLNAGWQASDPRYAIDRITLTVGGVEREVNFNRYGLSATSLFFMPDADVEVTVYYSRVYTATLDLRDSSPSRAGTADMTGLGKTVHHNDPDPSITGFQGGNHETVATVVTVPSDGKLRGVVYTSKRTGAVGVPLNGGGTSYDFIMPKTDVVVSPIIVPQDSKSLIAKVAFDPTSEGLDLAGNDVEIANRSDTTAASGPYWTLADPGDGVELTVHLEPGYQAVITAARTDGTGTAFYVSRTTFLADGTTASFNMPDLGEDVTVTVKFLRGYTATLDLTDRTGVEGNQADMTTRADGASYTVHAESDDTGAASYTGGTTPDSRGVQHVEKDEPVSTAVTLAAGVPAGIVPRVVRSTAFTGTQNVALTGGSYDFDMPGEDALVSVILDPNPLLAKVELRGDSDIVGNNDPKIDDIEPARTHSTGTVWTTAQGGDRIEVKLTVAKGYVAEVRIRRDDSIGAPGGEVYLPGSGYGVTMNGTAVTTGDTVFSFQYLNEPGGDGTEYVSDTQTLTFLMPKTADGDTETDVTVIIEYSFAGSIPAPHDPGNLAEGDWDLGYIYGENRSSYALIEVPTLHDNTGYEDADQRDGGYLTYHFFVEIGGNYVELVQGVDIDLTPADPLTVTAGAPYNYYDDTYTDTSGVLTPDPAGGVTHTGARFRLSLVEGATSPQAAVMASILDNDGTTGAPTNLYIVAQNVRLETSDYVQVRIEPVYTIVGTLISYAPQHETNLKLYKLGDGTPDPMDPNSYPVKQRDPSGVMKYLEPFTSAVLQNTAGTDLWEQEFAVGSSELLNTDTDTFMLVIEKAGNITYQRVNLVVDTAASYYDAGKKQFRIEDPITLIPGDLTGDRYVNAQDRDLLVDYLTGTSVWTEAMTDGETGWSDSIYNPAALAYAADLDGDGRITVADRDLLADRLPTNYKAYYVPDAADVTKRVVPNGFTAPVTTMEELAPLEEGALPPEGLLPGQEEGLPEVPADPEDPADPTDPETPTDPTDPADPVDPVIPADPTDPVDPDLPTAPVDPVDPMPPEEPAVPTPPAEPADPEEPDPPEVTTPSEGSEEPVLPPPEPDPLEQPDPTESALPQKPEDSAERGGSEGEGDGEDSTPSAAEDAEE